MTTSITADGFGADQPAFLSKERIIAKPGFNRWLVPPAALAIHLWLGHRFGVERGLWPAGGTPEALQALSWCTWSYVTYGALVGRLHVATQGEEVWRNTAQAEAVMRQLNELLEVLDARLVLQPWMLGADYSLVDLVVGSVLGYSVYLGAPVNAHPHVKDWLARVQARGHRS